MTEDVPPTEPGTITLLRQAEKGDSTAIESLFQRFCRPGGYYDQMLNWVRGGTLSNQAEDIVQNAFLAFFRRLHAGSTSDILDRERLRGLLRCITRRREMNAVRERLAGQRSAERTESWPTTPEGEEAVADPRADPAWEYTLRELMAHLLASVEEKLRPAAEMMFEDRSVAEMAAALRVSEATVDRRRQRIKRKFGKLLRDLAPLDEPGADTLEG